MTERAVSLWIRDNLSSHINLAIETHITYNPDLIWKEEDLAGIAHREFGWKLIELIPKKLKFDVICSLAKGDYGQRKGEKEPQYHGYSFWQLDVNTWLEFIKSGEWKNPFKACEKAILTLEGKRKWLEKKEVDLKEFGIHRASIAAYNCGEGRVRKAMELGKDIDQFTFNHDYSKEVLRFSDMYKNLPSNN
jgi:hypothetical protein